MANDCFQYCQHFLFLCDCLLDQKGGKEVTRRHQEKPMVIPTIIDWELTAKSRCMFCPYVIYGIRDTRPALFGFPRYQICFLRNDLKARDFVVKTEWASGKKNRKGQRHLNDAKTREMLKRLDQYFESMVEVPRIGIGNRQTIDAFIDKEALLLVKFLRDERKIWIHRVAL